MGISSQVIKNGNGTDYPKRGDTITIEYTGYLYEPSAEANDYKGKVFDSSVGRGDFVTKIGEGKVIRGWDDGVIDMSLGERSTLTISR
ncbi:MAG: hypothetical protein M1835_001731 [Candelina submexicana]|nr:MAG: hypothetical protein M1835_001731 [Candelina submexicana]